MWSHYTLEAKAAIEGREMRVLGLETTCDETAAAIVARRADGRGVILSNQIRSQIAEHEAFGGVVPEIAARAHVEALDTLIDRALDDAGMTPQDIDAIAVSAGPGLIGGVMVGLTSAKALALALNKPMLAINHLEAHALTPRLTDEIAFPYLLLLASGGHTQLIAVLGIGQYHRLGGTIDDAIGEAFDKVAKMLGLPYPGGPRVEIEAEKGDPTRFDLPRPMLGREEPVFSLSGLKTAVRRQAEAIAPLNSQDISDLCASFQASVVDVVVDRVHAATHLFRQKHGAPNALVIAGGVAANLALRRALERFALETGLRLVAPPPALCTDNGAMVAWAGLERLLLNQSDPLDIAPRARWPLDARASPMLGAGRLGAKA